MKACPRCHRTWPDSGRFCPMDGAPLEALKPSPDPGLPVASECPTSPATPVAKATRSIPVAKVEPARKATRGTQSLKAVRKAAPPDEADTKVLPAVGAVPAPAPVTPPRPAPAARPAPAQAEAPTPDTRTTPAARRTARKDGFSETKWFQAGELVKEDEIGPEAYAPKDLEPRYKKTRDLPPEVRRKFSLERDGDGSRKDQD